MRVPTTRPIRTARTVAWRREPGPVDHPGEQVAAQVVGAEQVRRGRTLEAVRGHPVDGALRGEQRRETRPGQDHQDHRTSEQQVRALAHVGSPRRGCAGPLAASR